MALMKSSGIQTHGGDIFSAAAELGISWEDVLDFSASINPLGPSERVGKAIVSSLRRVKHYPSTDAWELRCRLAEIWGINANQILAGNGAADLLRDFCMRFDGCIAVPAFGEFHRYWPRASYCDLENPSTWPLNGALVLTRPANPTGSMLGSETVVDYLRRSKSAVLVDESFIDFTTTASMIECLSEFPRLFVLRSLTKFHALPGLRIGVLVGQSAAIEPFARIRPPWSVNVMAERAALAALEDHEHAKATREFIGRERIWLSEQIARLPEVVVWPSAANFIYIETEHASDLTRFVRSNGILVRDCTGWPGCERSAVRVAVRCREENEQLLKAWKDFACVT